MHTVDITARKFGISVTRRPIWEWGTLGPIFEKNLAARGSLTNFANIGLNWGFGWGKKSKI